MTEKLELYKCDICGNLVQVILPGVGELVCCGEAMRLLKAQTEEEGKTEKHVPVFIKDNEGKDTVIVGSTPHPMEKSHYIMFIETISEDKDNVQLKYLHLGEEAKMVVECKDGKTCALELCNIHGLWEGKSD